MPWNSSRYHGGGRYGACGARVAAATMKGPFFAFAMIHSTVLLPMTEVVYSSGSVPVCVILPATESTQFTS